MPDAVKALRLPRWAGLSFSGERCDLNTWCRTPETDPSVIPADVRPLRNECGEGRLAVGGYGDGRFLHRHEAREWTVGRLRLALAGVPDELPLRVLVPDEPGGDCEVRIVYDATVMDVAALDLRPAEQLGESRRLWFEICCDYLAGGYRADG